MHVIEIVTIIVAVFVAAILFRTFRPIIIFIVVLVWELLWKGLVPLLAVPFHSAIALRRRCRADGAATTAADSEASAESAWMAQTDGRVDAALAGGPTRVTMMDGVPPDRKKW